MSRMSHMMSAIEDRIEAEKNTVGTVCFECNNSAPYFLMKNDDFYQPHTCLICNQKKEKGILLEDFVFTLNGHIKDHYRKSESSEVTIRHILKRFTYDNEDVITKLSELLSNENNRFFSKNQKYENIVDADFIKKCINEAKEEWDKIAYEVKHTKRFNNISATNFYSNLISSCVVHGVDNKGNFNRALRVVEKGSVLYRARMVRDDDHKKSIIENPAKELHAPPEKYSTNSRMSPPGISFMYTAGNSITAISELHPYAGDIISVGKFICNKDMNFFDFRLLDGFEVDDAHILVNPLKHKHFQNSYLLSSLHDIIRKPFRATDTSYIETQIFAEEIRNYKGKKYDGIIFNSSQNKKGVNYVIFGELNKVSNMKDYGVIYDPENGVEFHTVRSVSVKTRKLVKKRL